MNKWARPFEGNRASASPAGRQVTRVEHQYFAFLSYSHLDSGYADWLHRELERFRVPSSLVGRLTSTGVVPRRLTPIFRDRHELAAADDLGDEIREALAASHCLIVLCSPAAARSKWTNAEIEEFKRIHPEGPVIAAIVDGEPFASSGSEECFPPALKRKYDRRGRATAKIAEPLAADLRESGDGKRLGFLKIVAGMLGLSLDDLVQRDQLRRQRRLVRISGASVVGMLVAGGLAVTALQARDEARDQRRQAEGLVEFMLGDLKDKLEPIGRLDALDGVGSRVLGYYSRQDTSELSDSGLLQRSRALSMMANVAYVRGDVDGARRLYREAMIGTAEAIRRDPSDPQRLFDHAQNVFWTADIARQRGRAAQAEAGMREYKRLADQMVALEPNNMQWRVEQQSADTNLGVTLLEHRRFGEATARFHQALQTIQGLATADPLNADYRKAVTESQTWLASALTAEGRLREATALRERHVSLLQQLLQETRDIEYRQKLVPAERYLGELYWFGGDAEKAQAHFRAAVDHAEALLLREPENRRWSYFAARARIDLAQAFLASGQTGEARTEVTRACNAAQRLVATDSNVQRWRAVQRDCWLMQTRLAAAAGDLQQASLFARRAAQTARSVTTTDPAADKYGVAEAYRLLGDVRLRLGDQPGAQEAWQSGLAAIPAGVAQQPREMAEHAAILQRLGRTAEARERMARLEAMEYRGLSS